MGKFEERLWSIVRGFLEVSQRDPALLVSALQVVELQELVDARLLAAGPAAAGLRKAWRRRCLQQVGNWVQDTFAPMLQQCSQLIAAGENTDARVTDILREADAFVAQLVDIYDHAAPCFPPRYHFFGYVCAEYHKQLSSMIDYVGLCAANLANSDILKVRARVCERAARSGAARQAGGPHSYWQRESRPPPPTHTPTLALASPSRPAPPACRSCNGSTSTTSAWRGWGWRRARCASLTARGAG